MGQITLAFERKGWEHLTQALLAIGGKVQDWLPVDGLYHGSLFLVGGCLRDALLGRPILDIDLAVPGGALFLARAYARRFRAALVPLDREHGVARLVLPTGCTIDITDFKAPSIEADLALRDFTINAMATPLEQFIQGQRQILDPFGGLADLRARQIRPVSPRSFQDDPLRMLRAFRLASQLGFQVMPETRTLIAAQVQNLRQTSAERIRDELFLLLQHPCGSSWTREMAHCGVWRVLFSNPFGDLDAAPDLLSRVESLLVDLPGPFQARRKQVESYLDTPLTRVRNRRWLVKLAALLYPLMPQGDRLECAPDPSVAKPSQTGAPTATPEAAGQEHLSKALTFLLEERLRLSRKEQDCLTRVLLHPRFFLRLPVKGEERSLQENLYQGLHNTQGEGIGVLLLAYAVATCNKGPVAPMAKSHPGGPQHHLFEQALRLELERQSVARRKSLITGHDLINRFGLLPGPPLGVLLANLEREEVLGRIRSKAEAECWVQGYLDRMKN